MKRIAFAAATVLVLGAGPLLAADRMHEDATQRDADDTGKNVGDRDRDVSGTKTPMDQSNDPADVKLTQHIRSAITGDDSLSTNANNVKIIASGGVVTLRGPVDSAGERDKIANVAKHITGVKRVDNQLEISEQ